MTEEVVTVKWGHREYTQVTLRDDLGRYGVSVRANKSEAREMALQRLQEWQFWRDR